MNETYFTRLGHISHSIGDSGVWNLKKTNLRFRIEGWRIRETKEFTYVMKLIITSSAGEQMVEFEQILDHLFFGNSLEGGLTPSMKNRELKSLAEAKGVTHDELYARVVGNSCVAHGAKLKIECDHKPGTDKVELECTLYFGDYLGSAKISVPAADVKFGEPMSLNEMREILDD
ncbi:hypothetical protein KGP36_07070 [Patescibacteria group bacterium]|nr:hypothetical protein [Patescibacteria group bacterium]MDE1941254.1 hypothetical protein [Patescibacteria group bacterium]